MYGGWRELWVTVIQIPVGIQTLALLAKLRYEVQAIGFCSSVMHHPIFLDRAALAAICHRHHIRRLALFGSTLRGTDRPDSDVDLLVEFELGHKPGLLGLAGIEAELSVLAGGRRVDLRTAQDLSRYFRDEVVSTAEVQYAA